MRGLVGFIAALVGCVLLGLGLTWVIVQACEGDFPVLADLVQFLWDVPAFTTTLGIILIYIGLERLAS